MIIKNDVFIFSFLAEKLSAPKNIEEIKCS